MPREDKGPDRWLDRTHGKHRQAFDAPALGGGKPLLAARNYLDAYRDSYGLQDDEVGAVVVVHGTAWPFLFDDAAWDRLGIGEVAGVEDPSTRKPARRNVFAMTEAGGAVPLDASISVLQERGVVFLLCNNTLERTAEQLAQVAGRDPDTMAEELRAALLPGVELVPAAVVALNRAQEEGFGYFYAG